MNKYGRAALAFACMGTLYVLIGIPMSVIGGRAFGSPLFWLAAASFAVAWGMERKAAHTR
ncbi:MULTISPECIES: hypothetical protein [Streptomyces]|uniref:hypothetical protein n=1 Tax=Streptomyces TaxID=1883 RepID=UPI000D68084C|nr:hypothetical protein [Streptomyces sp. NWU339]PWI09640.1 hypothetical protein DIZ27_16305 [Streptomyces sp. NWU339]